MTGSIENVKRKIDWAAHHFDFLRIEVAKYLQANPPKFVIKREDTANGEVWGNFSESAPMPQEISLILGDILQTAHSSLDYLVCELVRTGKEEPTASNQFIIAESRSVFDEEIGRKRLRNVPFPAIAIMEGLQPYNTGEDPTKSPLFALKTLTNIHKHRNLLLASLAARKAPSDINIFEIDGRTYTPIHPSLEMPFDLDAEFGPFSIDGPNVNMDGAHTSVVVLAETAYKGREICSLIGWICVCLQDTFFPLFAPFFA